MMTPLSGASVPAVTRGQQPRQGLAESFPIFRLKGAGTGRASPGASMPLLGVTDCKLRIDRGPKVLAATRAKDTAAPAKGHGRKPDVAGHYDVAR